MSPNEKSQTVDQYFASLPPEARPLMDEIRSLVAGLVPEAEEIVSYGMPAFRKGRIFFYYAVFKKHLGIFPPVTGNDELIRDLSSYRGPRGNLKFPLNEPMPWELIRRVVGEQVLRYSK